MSIRKFTIDIGQLKNFENQLALEQALLSAATNASTATQVQFLLDIGILAVAALIFSVVFARLKIAIVSGQILAGMIVGPYVLGLVRNPVLINEISEIGIVLLLFIIGLELDPIELGRMMRRVVPLTILEVGIAFAFGWLASIILGFDLIQSVIFAMAASVTSTAIVGRLLLARRQLKAPEAKFLMGLTVFEDIAAILFLIILSSISSSNIASFPYFVIGQSAATRGIFAALEALAGGIGLILLGYAVARYIAPIIINHLSAYEEEFEEIPFLFALGLAFLFAIIAAFLGYSPGIGAFIIGLSIRGKHSRFLEKRIAPIKDLFLVLFFVSIGSLIDPVPALVLGSSLVLVLILVVSGKFVGGFLVGKIFARVTVSDASSVKMPSASAFGVRLIPRGEFSLLIVQLALALGLIDQVFFSLVGVTVIVTAILSSVLQRFTEPRTAPSIYPFKGKTDGGGG
jgi:Kef-type K+ transport system membrane component KefB